MNKVEIYSNWCYCDMLDNVVLKNDESLYVLWPDGSKTKELVKVEDHSYQGSDHGSPTTIGVTKAYIQSECKGVKALIRLYDSGLLCERVDPLPVKPSRGRAKGKKSV